MHKSEREREKNKKSIKNNNRKSVMKARLTRSLLIFIQYYIDDISLISISLLKVIDDPFAEIHCIYLNNVNE